MNVNKALTKNYENKTLGGSGKNKANTKPIKANFRKAKMNVTTFLTKDYENKSNWAIFENKPNSNPIQTQSNPTCRGVASGEAGSNPISEAKKSDEQATSRKDEQVTRRKENGEVRR